MSRQNDGVLMKPKKSSLSAEKKSQIRDELRRETEKRQKSYRERALKLFPHICARCTREFEGKRLRELTVHHKDHDHDNNPPDGGNWELLCIYCHDHEHDQLSMARYYEGSGQEKIDSTPSISKPFEGLKDLLKSGSDKPDPEEKT